MEYILTGKQMREADEHTISVCQKAGFSLMQNAGGALAKTAEKIAPIGSILIVCGGGNNGGDGLVCARVLEEKNRTVHLVVLSEKLSPDCQKARDFYLQGGGKIREKIEENKTYALVIDCMFGTGFHGELQEAFSTASKQIAQCRKQGTKVLCADIPSGVHGDNGFACENAVVGDYTLCLGERKAGAYLNEGIDHAGEVLRADIGILLPEKSYARLLDDAAISSLLPKRKRNAHKGVFGKAAIFAGSEKYTGAAALSLFACLRSGAGYTTLFAPQSVISHFYLKYPEALLENTNEGGRVAFNEQTLTKLLDYNAVAFGMGVGISEEVAACAKWLLNGYQGKLILDADALNSLAKFEKENLQNLFQNASCQVLITPHLKEFSRLSGESVESILASGFSSAFHFAKENKICVLLKNAVSVITNGEEIFLSTTGTSGQAKGGSGDVLSGVIAGLCASGLSVFSGAKAGAYIVGKAAEIAVKKTGEYSLLASDTVDCLGQAFLSIAEYAKGNGEGE